MDPNETLRELREMVALGTRSDDASYDAYRPAEVAMDMIDKLGALDRWISGGGALPDAWKRPAPSLPAEYSAVGMTDWKWAARLSREASTYGPSE